LLPNAFKKSFGRFVRSILGYEATLECLLQDALAQAAGAFQVSFDLCFYFVDN
jgi:hypothetical protein